MKNLNLKLIATFAPSKKPILSQDEKGKFLKLTNLISSVYLTNDNENYNLNVNKLGKF
jgi:hypothetical protein